jgi:hypothetical protein
MKKLGRYGLVLVVLIMVTLLAGCLKSSPSTAKTYKLTVTVLDEATKTPLVGARVEIVGKGAVAKVTNANGQVSFSGLSGSLELLVSSIGYANQTQFVMMERAQSITIYLATAAGAAVVGDERALAEALGDSTTTSITLTKDLVLSTKLSFDRPVLLNLNGKTLTGDVEYAFETEGELELTGSGVINGDLSINAPYASVTNHLHVTGTVTITDVAGETWHEYGHDNHLVVAGSNLRVNLYNDAQSITITEGAWGIRVNIYQGTVGDFVANSSVEVTGADKISRALVQAEGVVFDYSPGEIGGAVEPVILNPDPDDSEPEEIAGPRFATVSKRDGRYFNFERGEASSAAGEEDLKLTWVQNGNEYSMIGFTNCDGVRFGVDQELVEYDVERIFEHFRTVTAADWESSAPDETIYLEEFDTLILKTNTDRFVKLFILAMRGHWQHDDAAAVDFVYHFLDEVDLTPPVLESVTLVTESGAKITKPVHGGAIEFETAEDPEVILFTFNEVVYQNRPLAQSYVDSPFGPYKFWFYAHAGYLGSPFAKEFSAGFSGTTAPGETIQLFPGDEEFYADFDNDQGYFFSDLSGNQLRTLPFTEIQIKRTGED